MMTPALVPFSFLKESFSHTPLWIGWGPYPIPTTRQPYHLYLELLVVDNHTVIAESDSTLGRESTGKSKEEKKERETKNRWTPPPGGTTTRGERSQTNG